jgi:thymidylate synthase
MNKLDQQYTDLLQDILDNGVTKQDRTGTGTISVFGRQIRHDMKDGFPLLTTKKMPFKTIVTELLWFLRGDTDIKYLVDNNCHIWDGDCYQAYLKSREKTQKDYKEKWGDDISNNPLSQEEFINKIKTDDEFAKRWGELGPIYGAQWRNWGSEVPFGEAVSSLDIGVDQIQNLINDLKTNPDSRRLMVNAWNVGELDQMVLPPCHYGFQVYTRELTWDERHELAETKYQIDDVDDVLDKEGIPTRAISLMWNQRSVDTFLGLPFNIASYGLLLEIIAKEVNMVPEELIGNLGDVHLYSNHIEQAKEQIGRELTLDERGEIFNQRGYKADLFPFNGDWKGEYNSFNIPTRTREPFPLPTLKFNPCPITGISIEYQSIAQFEIENYQSHPAIKAPLSN